MAEAGYCASLIYSRACVLSIIVHCSQPLHPVAEAHDKRRKGSRIPGRVPMERRTGGAALWAGLEQISRLADSGGKGSDVSVIRDLAQEQGPQRNQPVSRLTITKKE